MTQLNSLAQIYANIPDGTFSRRTLFKRAAALGLATPAIASLLAACADNDDDVDEPATEPSDDEPVSEDDEDEFEVDDDDDEEAEAATSGGQLRVGVPGSADNFDPHMQTIFESIWVNELLYAGLVRIGADMEPEADIALDWESNETGDEWTFNVRTDVVFHNGRTMEVDDIVQNFERILDPDEGSPHQAQIDMIDEVEAVADDQVVLHLASPQPDLPALLGNYFVRIVPMEEVEDLQSTPVGSGPYQLRSHSAGERTVLGRFDDYFDLENQAFIEEIHFIAMEEEATRLTALVGESIDMVHEVSPALLAQVEDQPNLTVDEIITGGHQPLIMDVREEPFDDVRVRQALKLAINRAEFVAAATQGHGEEAADQPVPPGDPLYGGVPIPERDVDRARALLAEAGYEDDLALTLHTSTARAGMQESALTFQEMAEAIGVTVEIVNHPADAYWADTWKQVPFFATNWSGRPSADNIMSLLYICDTPSTESNWCNEDFDSLIEEARANPDPDERAELYAEAQHLLSEEGPAIIPYFRSYISAYTNRLQGYELNPLRFIDLRRSYLDE